MAKKETKKTRKNSTLTITNGKQILGTGKGVDGIILEDLTDLISKAAFAITEINKRIDRIVLAIDKSKSVRGL